jgi:TonB-linked SusC/RagA family outer membrane protein
MVATLGIATANAQGGVTVSGRVTSTTGAPIAGASVFIAGMNIGTQTGDDGRYTFTVGAARATGQTATLTARVIGYTAQSTSITLTAGSTITHDFVMAVNPLRLGEVVVTGAGTSTTRERLATAIHTVDSSVVRRAVQPQNVVSALAGTTPNVDIRTQSGDPGASASIRIRGASSLSGTNQPLFVVDGQPIDNQTNSTSPDGVITSGLEGTVTQNRAADINPADIESVEILMGSAASAIYGARAANGVVLITTKRGHAGPTRWDIASTTTFDNPSTSIPLQRSYALGTGGVTATCSGDNCVPNVGGVPTPRSWGALIPAGTPTYDHSNEIFKTGETFDNNVAVSGGNDRTTFYISGGLTNQDGIVIGPNNKYNRLSARVKGSQQVTSTFNVGGNFNYIDSRGRYVQKGSNPSGLMLGALRTPPEFNNADYLTATGVQRTYRFPNATDLAALQNDINNVGIYDNPFYTAYVNNGNQSELGRAISNINMEWDPLDWLNVKYTLGGDYYNDWRLQTIPMGAGFDAAGNITRDDFNNLEIDHNLLATAKHSFSDNVDATFTLGQNLNSRRNRSTYILGEGLIVPTPYTLQNTSSYTPIENRSLAHIESYFGQLEFSLYNQLYLTAGLRNDGFSTFGQSNPRANYPKASAAWTFTNFLGNTDHTGVLSYGKLRLAYGETGKEPPFYAAVPGYSLSTTFGSGYQDVLTTLQGGYGGVVTESPLTNPNLKPERQKELEGGIDLGLFNQRADIGFTIYNKRSSDVILAVPTSAAVTGALSKYENGASITNRGFELTANVRAIQTKDVQWELGFNLGRNKGNVNSLLGAQFVTYNDQGFSGAIGSSTVGYAPGVIRGSDFARCGQGLTLPVTGLGSAVDIDAACGDAPAGALFLGPNGLPVNNPAETVIGDPNPKYTMGFNTSLKIGTHLTLSTMFDVRKGAQVWDGTRGALYAFGTDAFTLVRSSTTGQFGKNFYTNIYPVVAGPGVNVVPFTSLAAWQSWFTGQGGSGSPAQDQFIEDGDFVKWRELSLTYTFDSKLIQRWINFSSADVRIAGRNLKTWTSYQGLDPEANLQGAESLTQGIDYFGNPQTRSFVVSITLNR